MELKNLARLRTARGISQAELADLIGVSVSAVGHWESGHGITSDNMMKLCRAFDVDPAYLLGLAGSNPKKAPKLYRVA